MIFSSQDAENCRKHNKKMIESDRTWIDNVTAIHDQSYQSIQLKAVARARAIDFDIPNPRDLVENLWNLHHAFYVFNHWLGHLDTKTNHQKNLRRKA